MHQEQITEFIRVICPSCQTVNQVTEAMLRFPLSPIRCVRCRILVDLEAVEKPVESQSSGSNNRITVAQLLGQLNSGSHESRGRSRNSRARSFNSVLEAGMMTGRSTLLMLVAVIGLISLYFLVDYVLEPAPKGPNNSIASSTAATGQTIRDVNPPPPAASVNQVIHPAPSPAIDQAASGATQPVNTVASETKETKAQNI